MMRTIATLGLLALLASAASATVLSAKQGTLETFAATGTGTHYVSPDKAILLVQYTSTGATGCTVHLEISADSGTTWTTVTGSEQTPTSAAPVAVSMTDAIGLYRAVCTALTNACSVKYLYGKSE